MLRCLVLCVLLWGMFGAVAPGQCIVSLPPVIAVCPGQDDPDVPDTVRLGDALVVSNVQAPLSFRWASVGITPEDAGPFLASILLDDTTDANPRVVDRPGESAVVSLLVEVTDSQGVVCTDTVAVQFSVFYFLLIDRRAVISPGDTTRLGPGFVGGFPPYAYHWEPPLALSDPAVADPLAFPDTSTVYQLYITDAIGCEVRDLDPFEVTVVPNALKKREAPSFQVFPNPARDVVYVECPASQGAEEWWLTDLQGRVRLRHRTGPGMRAFRLSLGGLAPGIYWLGRAGEMKGELVVKQ